MDAAKIKAVAAFCHKQSRESPNRVLKTVKNHGAPTNVRFLLSTKAQLRREFNKTHPQWKISSTIFNKYIPKQYKPAKRDQDKCDTCLELKKRIKKLQQLRKDLIQCGCLRIDHCLNTLDDYSDETPYKLTISRCSHLSAEVKQHWIEILDTIHELQFHRTVSHSQNESYLQDIERCRTTKGQMLVVNDWKENYTMKGGTIATGRDFYHTVQVSIMGVIIFCKDIENGKAQKLPIVSNVLTHDGTTAIMNTDMAIQRVKSLYPTVFATLQGMSIWSDSGPHYRNKEFAHYALHETLVKYKLKRSRLNFFGEKHGKNDCDAMFSHIGGFLTNAEQSQRVDSIQKICEIIKTSQSSVNDEKKEKNEKGNKKTKLETTTIIPIPWEISENEEGEYKSNHPKMDFNGITAYYCLSATSENLNKKKIIYNHGISSNTTSIPIKWNDGTVARSKDPKKNPTSDPESDKHNFTTLTNANTKLREALYQIDRLENGDSEEEVDDIDIDLGAAQAEFHGFLYDGDRVASVS